MIRRFLRIFLCALWALSALPACSAETLALNIDEGRLAYSLRKTEKKFTMAYRELWKAYNLDSLVVESVDSAVSRAIEGKMWGTKGLSLMFFNDNEAMIKRISYAMNEPYEKMTAELEKRFADILEEEVKDFYQITVFESTMADGPMQKAFIRNMSNATLRDRKTRFIEVLQKSINSQENFENMGWKAGRGIVVAITTQAFKKKLAGVILRRLGGAAVSKVSRLWLKAIPVVGWGFALWDITSVAIDIGNAESVIREELKVNLKDHYTRTMPDLYWQAMKDSVEGIFRATAEKVSLDRAMAAELASNPDIIALGNGLDESSFGSFACRLALISRTLDIDVNSKSFLSEWGAVIRDCPEKAFSKL